MPQTSEQRSENLYFKTRSKQLVKERLPRWSEEQAQRALQAAEEPEPNGTGDEGVSGDPIPTLEEVFAVFSSVDFPPHEDAWR